MVGPTSFDARDLGIVRRAYAKQMLALAGVEANQELEDAFAAVPREDFLGEPPWHMLSLHGRGYQPLPSADPVLVYQNINFALAPERGVNNGSPALHAGWLHHAAVKKGERVAHIGAGAGYYTALLAHLVGPEGHVLAVEFNASLADVARRKLAHLANVTVVEGDGGEWPREAVDCIYVNFLVPRPAESWIDHLRLWGRLIFPLGVPRPSRSPTGGTHTLYGAGLCVERQVQGLAARWLGAAFFVCAEGPLAGKPEGREGLKAAFERGGVEFVRSLRWGQPPVSDRNWYVGPNWSLSYDGLNATER
jgi:protein-L-isoaspartate(D-aspartate) O-methyltransferase